MISSDQLDKALKRLHLNLPASQVSALQNDLFPIPQCGLSGGGVHIWGDRASLDKVERALHVLSQAEILQERLNSAAKMEKIAVDMLNLVLMLSAENPAHVGSYRNLAQQMLDKHKIEAREGFFTSEAVAIRDAAAKLLEASA